MIESDLFVSPVKIKLSLIVTCVRFSVFTLIQQEELMRWHLGAVKRTMQNSSHCIGVNFSELLIMGKEF